jgi:hypothetical protein
MTEGYVFYIAPGASSGDPLEDTLLRGHEAEADAHKAEFWNYGWVTGENSICSKTSIGFLDTHIDPNTMHVSHRLITYEEKACDEEQFQRRALEHLGKSLRDHVVRQLRPLREVYDDLPEFAPICEAIDKLT